MIKKLVATGAIAAASAGLLMLGAPAASADDAWFTSGNGSILGGNQIGVDADVPVNVCGNAIGILGNAGASCEDSGAASIDD